jgi:hypothetical protein
LRNVKVVFYHPNCTSVVQPLDLSLIKCFKQVYRKQLVQRAVCLMDAGKGVQPKINILCAIHCIVSAWQSTKNCFVKCGHLKKNQEGSDVAEVNGSGEEEVTQDEDWVQLRASIAGLAFDAYMSVDQKLATYGVLCMEEMWCTGKWKLRGGAMMVVMMTMKPSPNQC